MNMNSKTWRCFHCDEVFRTRESAWQHFGPDEYEEKHVPACIDPLRIDEKARITELRESVRYALECQTSANEAGDRLSNVERELDEFKIITKCQSAHELRMWMDSQEGRVGASPELTANIIQSRSESSE